MRFLLSLILIGFIIYLFAKSVRGIFHSVFGAPQDLNAGRRQTTAGRPRSQKVSEEENKDSIVPDGAGEYVDFEEVKDDKK